MTSTYDRFNSWKGLIYADRLEQCAKGGTPHPVNWHTYISNKCPYDCEFCIMQDEHAKHKNAMLPEGTLDKLADDADRLGVKLVHISGGGEPLTHPYVNEFIRRLKDRRITVAMSTNGYHLDRLDAQVDHLRVSFNAGTKESYARVQNTKPESFDRVRKNLETAVKERKGKDIGMGFVVTHLNYHEIPSFVKIAEESGVGFVHIRPGFWPQHNEEIMKAIGKVSVKSDKVDVFAVTEKFGGFWDDKKYPCRATPLHAVTAATGEFLICQDRLDLRWGDYNEQTFEEIWSHPKHYELMREARDCDIRCVECRLNEIIERVFVRNDIRRELI